MTATRRRTRPLSGAFLATIVALLSTLLLAVPAGAAIPRIDFTDLPSEPVTLPDGWAAGACDGDGPLLCFTEEGTTQGVLEHLDLALADQTELSADLADGVPLHAALVRDVDRYHRIIRTDRGEVCPDMEYRPDPTVGATVAGLPAVQWGASIIDLDEGRVVERTVGFTVVRGDRLDLLVATEINEGACIDAEGLQPFHEGGLGRVTPTLVQLVARTDLGEGSAALTLPTEDAILEAEDAVGTAIALSQLAVPATRDGGTVLLARHDVLADALAGGLAQGVLDAPLLLTDGAALDPRVAEEIQRLGADEAVLLGGEAALSGQVADDLADLGLDVDRIAGADRVATALALADQLAPEVEQVLVVRADAPATPTQPGAPAQPVDPTQAFADAIGAGALAADHHAPILLTDGAALDDRVAAWLDGRGVEEAVLVGGEQALGLPVAQELVEIGMGIDRLAGAERAETASLVAHRRGVPTIGHADVVVLVDGRTAADGLAAALLAHHTGAPILLADGETLPTATRALLTGADPAAPLVLVCTPSVQPGACNAAHELLIDATAS